MSIFLLFLSVTLKILKSYILHSELKELLKYGRISIVLYYPAVNFFKIGALIG
jgi:hypothetical protein